MSHSTIVTGELQRNVKVTLLNDTYATLWPKDETKVSKCIENYFKKPISFSHNIDFKNNLVVTKAYIRSQDIVKKHLKVRLENGWISKQMI